MTKSKLQFICFFFVQLVDIINIVVSITNAQKKGPMGLSSEIFNGTGRAVAFRTNSHSLCRTSAVRRPKSIRLVNKMMFGFVDGHTMVSFNDSVLNL